MEKRTLQQNKALHKFFEMLSADLNYSGLDMKRTLKPSIDIPWTAITVKNYLWKPIQDAMLEKVSTTELTTKEVNSVYETLIRHLAEKFGITTPFPNIEEIKEQ
jgi:hypothetical protein